ncbi:MAG: peptide chain release factor N(5)-glutamine methyltransferase [Cyanobacteria bacterium SIG29]|nr:peptide chain release factor N(5)-glutamine methyltransferase [Cyanobacteria bacterium SIG29]
MYRKGFIDRYLKNGFEFDEAVSEVDFALDVLFGFSYKNFMLGKTLENWQITKYQKVLEERLSTRKPIQQIVGQAYFWNKKFFVNEHTLIPRPETELLVQETLVLAKEFENPKILDIGSGSGCIPITLVMENKNIIAESVDISVEALEIARKNALFHNVHDRVNFYSSDVFENVTGQYDIIVSNPPYIPLSDKDTLAVEVRDFDPYNALFTKDEKGIEFYERISVEAKKYLSGYLVFEIGINQSELVQNLLRANGYEDIRVINDYNLIPRIIISRYNFNKT